MSQGFATLPQTPMPDWDISKLAREIHFVATVRLGWPLRKNAKTKQLRQIAEALTENPASAEFTLFEAVLRPSIECLGNGPIGNLAKIEFGLTEDSKTLRYLYQRQEMARNELDLPTEDVLKARENAMFIALARDLIVRWKASQPAPQGRSVAEEAYAGMTAEEESKARFLAAVGSLMRRASTGVEGEIMRGEITEEQIDEEFKRSEEEGPTKLEERFLRSAEEHRGGSGNR